jgi:hypothetical protein
VIGMGQSEAKANCQGRPIDQELELWYPRRSETFVVAAVNDVGWVFCCKQWRMEEKLKRFDYGESLFARMKFKVLDGRAPPIVELAA